MKKIGEILLEKNLIDPLHLEEALEIQRQDPKKTLGQILRSLGYLKDDDLQYILESSGKRQRLADIILSMKLLDNEQLAKAMAMGKQEGVPLHKAILRLSLLTEEQVARLVAGQYDIPFVQIQSLELDPELARFINPSYAHKQKILPVSRIGNTLTLASAYPLKFHEIKDLEMSIRLKIIPVIATETDIILGQQKLYKDVPASGTAGSKEFESALDNIGELLSTIGGEEPDVDDEVRKVTEKDSVIVKLVNKIIVDAHTMRASDIHIEPYPGKADIVVRMRIDGRCKTYQRIPYKYKYALPSRIKIMSDLDITERRRPQDGKINFGKFGPLPLELRVAVMPTSNSLEDVVLRILPSGDPIEVENLGLSQRNQHILEQCLDKPYGLILVVGPTGSGKTTTLHSAISRINKPEIKIWTAEDPVEITQPGLRQVQVNPKIGFTFASTLRAFLRLDPDVILVGEMRDLETATTCIEASLTGHLVLSTLHTNSAPETITRLLEMGLDAFSFSDSLLCIVAQRLARLLCSECKENYTPSADELEALIEEFGPEDFKKTGIDPAGIKLARAHGCSKCAQTGYRGRIGLHEVLESTDGLRRLMRKKSDPESIRMLAVAEGMTTLKQDGILKAISGQTDIHEVRRVCLV